MLILRNGMLMTMDRPPFEGDIAMADGKIVSVGKDLPAAEGATEIDVAGCWVTPGIVDAHSHIGLMETGTRDRDHNEVGDPIAPSLRAIDGINPQDPAFELARASGMTTCVACPGSMNLIGGMCAAVKTAGDWVGEMVIDDSVAMKMALGENPKFRYTELGRSPKSRMAAAGLIRDALARAGDYGRRAREANPPPRDLGLEALARVVDGEIPMKIHVHRADDIATAIRLAEEFGLTYTLDHCTEGFMIPDLLRQAMTRGCRGVIAGPLIGYNGKREVRNSLRLDYPRRLWELNIPFAICTDYYENPVELLRTIATLSAAEGLPEDVALAAITSDAARIAGLGDRVGRLIPGLDADVAVFSGPPISIHSKCLMTVVNGSIVYEKRG